MKILLTCVLVALASFGITALIIGARDGNRVANKAGFVALGFAAAVTILMAGVSW